MIRAHDQLVNLPAGVPARLLDQRPALPFNLADQERLAALGRPHEVTTMKCTRCSSRWYSTPGSVPYQHGNQQSSNALLVGFLWMNPFEKSASSTGTHTSVGWASIGNGGRRGSGSACVRSCGVAFAPRARPTARSRSPEAVMEEDRDGAARQKMCGDGEEPERRSAPPPRTSMGVH